MSSRTALTVRAQDQHPEEGPTTKTMLNADVANGNKVQIEPNVIVFLYNFDTVDPHDITFTYDGDDGQVATKVLTLAAGEGVPVQLEARMGRHASDGAEHGYAWFTADGTAGEVVYQAVRLKHPLRA